MSTSGHGGLILSEERCRLIPPHLSLRRYYYEDDCEARLVELAFPLEFKDYLPSALSTIGIYATNTVPCIRRRGAFDSDGCYEPPSSEVNQLEQEVINYLSECVLYNRKPIYTPSTSAKCPQLQGWVDCLAGGLKVDCKWPMSNKKWKEHFFVDRNGERY
ncbi:MAG: hypothetical protein HAW67_04465 [Endozoicomonadaceae bacterium]|nr:hypothetical protein [Endozoicomonadaceae bacterium]